MKLDDLTTPFGARGLSLGMLRGRASARTCPEKAEGDKWAILRHLTIARHRFSLSDRSVTVLSALLSFFPAERLAARDDLLVFPSNAELMRRAHGISEATLRRCLHQLVDAGLILRRDSPNGKRYARRNADGSIGRAFGFDLKPLLCRAPEIAAAAARIVAEKQELAILREDVTLLRRDIRKVLAYLLARDGPADCSTLAAGFQPLEASSNRGLDREQLQSLRSRLLLLRETAEKHLKRRHVSPELDGNDQHHERHKQDSKPISLLESEESRERYEKTEIPSPPPDCNIDGRRGDQQPGARLKVAETRASPAAAGQDRSMPVRLPLDMVLRACPDIHGYARHGIRNWNDLRAASGLAGSVLGVTRDAWVKAEQQMGVENAATTMAAILQRCDKIRSPGGYLRILSQRAAGGLYSPVPVIEALLRRQ